MLNFSSAATIFVASSPVDMRKGHIGLSNYISNALKKDPLSGSWFIFFGKRSDRVKIFYWDDVGMCFWYKVLPEGIFRLPKVSESCYSVTSHELNLLLSGIDFTNAQRLSTVSTRMLE